MSARVELSTSPFTGQCRYPHGHDPVTDGSSGAIPRLKGTDYCTHFSFWHAKISAKTTSESMSPNLSFPFRRRARRSSGRAIRSRCIALRHTRCNDCAALQRQPPAPPRYGTPHYGPPLWHGLRTVPCRRPKVSSSATSSPVMARSPDRAMPPTEGLLFRNLLTPVMARSGDHYCQCLYKLLMTKELRENAH